MAEIRLVAFVRRFLRTLSPRQMATVLAEDFLGMLLRPIPGFSGFTLRWLFYRLLFKRLGGYSFIYKGVYFEHCYGIDAGKNLHVSAGAVLYGRGGLTNGDVIVHDGLAGASPVSLFGIKYHQNNTTTGTWLNLNRATYPQQLATPRVNAANSALVPGYVRLAINKVRKALGINQLGKLIAYTSVEQEHAWENLGITISQVIKETAGGSANDLDLLFSGRKTMSGVPIKSSINADQTRVDFLDLSHWGRAVIKDIDYFEVGGNTVFPIYGGSGGLAAAFIFYFDTGFQVWNDSPRSGSFIDALARPSGY